MWCVIKLYRFVSTCMVQTRLLEETCKKYEFVHVQARYLCQRDYRVLIPFNVCDSLRFFEP